MLPATRPPPGGTGPMRPCRAMGTATGDRRLARSEPGARPAAGSPDERLRRIAAHGPEIVLGLAVVGWALLFSVLVYLKHDRFASVDFDMGIHDQSVWLLAHFRGFLTVRGLAGVRPPRDARVLPLRPLLLVGRRAAPAQHHAGRRRRARRGPGVPAGPVPHRERVGGDRARRRLPPAPRAAVLHVRAVPPRGARDHPAALRLLLLGAEALGLVRVLRGARGVLEGRRRARDRDSRARDRAAGRPPGRARHGRRRAVVVLRVDRRRSSRS